MTAQSQDRLTPGAEAGITEDMIRGLVDAFYGRVRRDEMLGPIFNKAVTDWDAHLEKLSAFWSSVTLMTGRFKGTPMKTHADLPDLTHQHFDRWLAIFRETAREVCPAEAADVFIDRAERIAQSLELGVAMRRGQFPALGGRLKPATETARG